MGSSELLLSCSGIFPPAASVDANSRAILSSPTFFLMFLRVIGFNHLQVIITISWFSPSNDYPSTIKMRDQSAKLNFCRCLG